MHGPERQRGEDKQKDDAVENDSVDSAGLLVCGLQYRNLSIDHRFKLATDTHRLTQTYTTNFHWQTLANEKQYALRAI